MTLLARAFAATALLASPAWATEHLAHAEIYDRVEGRFLPIYHHAGRSFVAGSPGHEYEIVLSNRYRERLLAVTSVDGVNVVSGQTASPEQSGYVLGDRQTTNIDGWRKSLDRVAAFYFTRHRNAYASRTGLPNNVGVIGIALFREEYRPYRWQDDYSADYRDHRSKSAPAPQSGNRVGPSGKRYSERDDSLGTGHGRESSSGARHVEFERATVAPQQVITIYYDSRENLVAQGVIPRYDQHQYAQQTPQPFPGRFAADPPRRR